MGQRILVGTRKGLLEFAPGHAGQWTLAAQHFLGTQVSSVLVDGRFWVAALADGHFGPKMHISDNAGESWREAACPAFPALDDEKPTVEQVWCMAGVRERLWAGCIPAGLFRSDDGGGSWQLVRSLWDQPSRKKWFGGGYDQAGIHSILVDPRDADKVVLGISCGGVWRSDDAGESWSSRSAGLWAAYMPPESKEDPDIQDPHRLAQCLAAPDAFWCQHHNGQFRSRDNLDSWQEIWPAAPWSNFGFAVAAHPKDPLTAWFVPAASDERRIPLEGDFYVLRTRDGGASYQRLAVGLPTAPSFHLVYRHGLVVDDAGQTLAMGSTTGSLWASTDAGDSWQRISAELPPIHCVVFAG
ncbi:MAG: exo-alpha-sialidase [Burkholderiales bacterium]|nr:exo-alpha-sialidase [Burkholderiales bacterium]